MPDSATASAVSLEHAGDVSVRVLAEDLYEVGVAEDVEASGESGRPHVRVLGFAEVVGVPFLVDLSVVG